LYITAWEPLKRTLHLNPSQISSLSAALSWSSGIARP
jgi:hypothetical protein